MFVLASRFFPIDRLPARIDNDSSVRLERLTFHSSDARGHFKLRGRVKDRDGAARDHVENFALEIIEMGGRCARGDDGVVIAHLGVVEDALRRLDPFVAERFLGVSGQRLVVEAGHDLAHLAKIIFRQITRIGPRIGQHLMLLVKGLRDLKRAARA